MSIDLSIVIVSWNTAQLLEQCLESIYANRPDCTIEIWVVDNASKDDSVSMIRSCFPGVHLIDNHENVGFAGANNQALKLCNGSFVLLLNPDTIVKPKSLDQLIDFLRKNPRVGGIGPRLLNGDGSFQPSCYPFPTFTREFWRLFYLDKIIPYGSYDSSRWDQNTPREVDSLQGACVLLRREVLNQVGLFDESYFLYSEEIDLCYRMKRAGWRLLWLPEPVVVHFGGQSSKQVARKSFLNLYQGKVLFFRKHYGLIHAFLYRCVLLAATLVRLILLPFVWLEPKNKRQVHLQLANNYFHLLKALPRL